MERSALPARPAQFENYDPKMIQCFEILSSYYCDVFYNHTYTSSSTSISKSGKGGSLTEEYTRQVQAYLTGIKTDAKCYQQANMDLYHYFSEYYKSLSFPQYVDRVVSQFVPEKFFVHLKTNEKDEAMGTIVCGLVAALAGYSTTPEMLRRIIDQHGINVQVTHRMMQDIGISELISRRETLYNKFLKRQGQSRETVPANVVENLKETIRKLVRAKKRADEDADALYDEVRGLKKKLKEAAAKELKYRQYIALMQGKPLPARQEATSLREEFDDEPRPTRRPVRDDPKKPRPAVNSDFFKKSGVVAETSETKRTEKKEPEETSEVAAYDAVDETGDEAETEAGDPLGDDGGEPITALR
jgi:hypothetical protein